MLASSWSALRGPRSGTHHAFASGACPSCARPRQGRPHRHRRCCRWLRFPLDLPLHWTSPAVGCLRQLIPPQLYHPPPHTHTRTQRAGRGRDTSLASNSAKPQAARARASSKSKSKSEREATKTTATAAPHLHWSHVGRSPEEALCVGLACFGAEWQPPVRREAAGTWPRGLHQSTHPARGVGCLGAQGGV